MPLVRIIVGSQSDLPHAVKAVEQLHALGISNDMHTASAHRTPERVKTLIDSAEKDGVKVIIAMAGMAAHLPGVIASMTLLPVIGVPLSGSALSGIDALYAVVQMPPGIPVATVAVDGAKNSALLAAQIIALDDKKVLESLINFRKEFYN
ncbi:MAG TPA: 5-(carboxyamino)imidazole ribonucleotide mutase [Candidatus Cloacimonadota bacterium]|nr:5-(carboxyamino)imidazole ribonucleotide mutase [Candidatus Cloacimonadota bacterium]HOQ80824.1 5-(carboxyamino)imidazole ribonucleotide mutase [Candidatus Cloacimonadota bacterium]HPK40151.1 5-(carboxyamino)imidazole ribonucleotide mutase [Candidatus Cloacimonadota bacterium]